MYLVVHTCMIIVITLKGSDMPTVKEIINYMIRDRVTVDWRDLGIQLLPDDLRFQLDIIKSNYPADTKSCCTAMFEYWLQVDTTASWCKLIGALRKINKFHLAETISTMVLQGNSTL